MKILAMIGFLALACQHGNGGGSIDAAEVQCGQLTCSGTEFCDFELNSCGAESANGFETPICRRRGDQACANTPGPACACDDQIYPSRCDAQAAGVDVSANGNCPLRADQFRCGDKQCNLTDQICLQVWRGTGTLENSSYECSGVPADCSASPSCECLRVHQVGLCYSFCSGTAATGLTVTCAPAVE